MYCVGSSKLMKSTCVNLHSGQLGGTCSQHIIVATGGEPKFDLLE